MSKKTNLLLDTIIFFAFLLVANPKITGDTIHEWLSTAFFGTIIVHLLFHWKWIATICTKFFKKLFHQSRLNFVIDLLFFIAMVCSIFSGFMISKQVLSTLGIHLTNISRSWKTIHTLSSDISIFLLAIHFGLHWKWIANAVKTVVFIPFINLFRKNKITVQSTAKNEDFS